jgi:hypothetical protein
LNGLSVAEQEDESGKGEPETERLLADLNNVN